MADAEKKNAAVQTDHRHWRCEHQSWREDIRRWRSEFESAWESWERLGLLLQAHGEAIDAHSSAITDHEAALDVHERKMAEQQCDGKPEPWGAEADQAHHGEGVKHLQQHEAHGRLLQEHVALMTRLSAILGDS